MAETKNQFGENIYPVPRRKPLLQLKLALAAVELSLVLTVPTNRISSEKVKCIRRLGYFFVLSQ